MRADTKEERNDLMIGAITKSLKRTAQDMDIPIVLLSQFARVKDDREPMLSDLRGSGDIEQDADVVLFVHRNKMTPDVASIIIAKNRQGGRGRLRYHFTSRMPVLINHKQLCSRVSTQGVSDEK